jgi:hypothetical protein
VSFSVLDGDPHELTAQADLLGSLATALDGAQRQLKSVQDQLDQAGDNGVRDGVGKQAHAIEGTLQRGSGDLRKAQGVLVSLHNDLLGVDATAKGAQQQLHDAQSHPQTFGLAFIYEREVSHCKSDAAGKRNDAGAKLRQLAHDTPDYKSAHPSWFHRFTHDVGGIASDTVGGVVDGVKGIGGLTVEAVWNRHASANHWRALFDTVGTVAHHPGAAASGVFHAVIRPDLFKSDPAAWLVNIGSLFVGGAFFKAPKALSALGKAGRVGERLEAVGEGLRGTLGLSTTVKVGQSGKLLVDLGVPRANVKVMTSDGNAAIGARHVWERDKYDRGLRIEKGVFTAVKESDPNAVWLEEVVHNHEAIDIYDYHDGIMNSVKSIDPALPSYQNASAMRATITSYLNKLDTYDPQTIGGFPVRSGDIQVRQLTLAIPDSGISPAQAEALRDLHADWAARTNPIDLVFVEVAR